MKFRWEKLGIIFKPSVALGENWSYAQVPFTLKWNGRIRVYFSTRGKTDNAGQFVSRPHFVDYVLDDFPQSIEKVSEPIMNLGEYGDFDHFGSMAGSVVKWKDKLLLYYTGWDRAVAVPYQWNVGVAVGDDSGSWFTRNLPGPVIGPSPGEGFLFACPVVFQSESELRMFYLGGRKWLRAGDGKLESQYLLKMAHSSDGIHWIRDGLPLVSTVVPDESQTSATVIKINEKFYMFFSYRHGQGFREEPGRGYRIGLAVSSDMKSWERSDGDAGLLTSEAGWDSEMVAYPHLFSVRGQVFMLYCGNKFGAEGFGLARLKNSLVGSSWKIVTTQD